MKVKISFRCVFSVMLGVSGLFSFATYALADEAASPVQPLTPASFVSDGSMIKFDQERASIMPIPGYEVEPRGSRMALVMREVVTKDPKAPIDYTQPLFLRNLTVMTLNEASPIDETRAVSFEEEFKKMADRDGIMKDLQITSRKFFNYKGENDGLVFFSQHTANGFSMMQMMVLVSGDSKQYLLTYTDLAANFANVDTYNAAWNSMTSIMVPGVAPVRYHREAKTAGAVAAVLLMICAPFGLARFASQRRIHNMVAELQSEWDSGTVSQAQSEFSNISYMDTTRIAADRIKKGKKDVDVSSVSLFSDIGVTRNSNLKVSSYT